MKFFLFAIISVCVLGCTNNSATERKAKSNTSSSVAIDTFSGKIVFERFCANCHGNFESHMTDEVALSGVFERMPKPPEDYFKKFLKDEKALRDSGDKYAIDLAKQWNTSFAHEFKDSLALVEFGALIQYIKIESRLNQSK